MTRLLRDGQMSPEDVSNLLTRYLELMAGEPENGSREKRLGNGSARRVARRAQEYIEENYPGTIRMEDLCRYTGVSLRTPPALLCRVLPGESFRIHQGAPPPRRATGSRGRCLLASTVTEIAIASGFTHLGRFSVDYREHFGESPRETLAKRAPRWRGSVPAGRLAPIQIQ